MNWSRSSGILLHPTSLPGPYGIGELGDSAHRWIDFLAQSKQKLWQVLPLGPTGFADSPYACLSSFAGNPLLISLDRLVESGDLTAAELSAAPRFSARQVDYGAAIAFKIPLLQLAAQRFLDRAAADRQVAYDRFCRENAHWLEDWGLFIALKERFDRVAWPVWDPDIALREPQALAHWKRALASQIQTAQVLQFLFAEQWQAVKAYANRQGIQVIGDLPIFAAMDSADVWVNRDLFHLDQHGLPTLISGVPPDYFSETGQRWGNPLYRWQVMAERGYGWWIARLQATLSTVDIVRIDHFRGFVAYWEIPASEPTAVRGRWVPGPGAGVFEAIERALVQDAGPGATLPIIAEDLGVITPEVIALRERFGFPGMKILQFAFDEAALRASFGDYTRNPFLPHNYTRNFVVYTGTHDNDTALGWFRSCPPEERQKALSYLGCSGQDFHWALIRAAMASVADLVIVPLQDVLGLGNEARMNLPGTVGTNWTWRCPSDALTKATSERLAEMVELYER